MIRITNFKRVLCILCALLLVFSMTTRPVAAVSWSMVAYWVAGSLAAGAALTALGVLLEQGLESGNVLWQNAIADIQFAWKDRGYMEGDQVQVYSTPDGTLHLSEGMIETAREAIWNCGIVFSELQNGKKVPPETVIWDGGGKWQGLWSSVETRCVYFSYGASYSNFFLITDDSSAVFKDRFPFSYSGEYVRTIVVDGVTYYYANCLCDYDASYPYIEGGALVVALENAIRAYVSGEMPLAENVTVAEGLLAGHIAGQTHGLAEGYPEWSANAIQGQVEGQTETMYPVSIGASLEEIQGMTQEQVWAGGLTQVELQDTLQISLGQHLTSIKGFLQRQFQGLIQGFDNLQLQIQQSWQGLQELGQLFTTTTLVQGPLEALHFGAMLELFPFSIPYDLVQCINFWGASAEAPTLTIPLPTVQGGRAAVTTYDVNLGDLPGFNQIAALIRAGELILFGIGLVLITRKVTKW